MVSGSVARRYAKALFSLALERDRVHPWAEALERLGEVLRKESGLEELLTSPVYAREDRRALLGELVAALGLEPEPANLLYLLGDRQRLDRLADVLRAFGELADHQLGRVRARLTSAVPLEPAALDALAHRLSQVTKAQVLLERTVEPAILGGMVAQVGSVVYDGSVRTQLDDLKKSLKR
ncbi:MAG TPA: ATP synthase F1 subunit delta [Anaeromyxobacter sp.]|nr:ATP synthase F1 subunit delta [Anaeromyxobacter sp.]HVO20576.1 ATP synthase F1 subunit delta [Anaeromyxobacter sp.]